MKDEYSSLDIPTGTHIEPCPCCSSDGALWQYIAADGGVSTAVMCSHGGPIGPQDGAAYDGCPLYMPNDDFYRATIREAVKYWNEFAKALTALNRKNSWQRHKQGVLREGAKHD